MSSISGRTLYRSRDSRMLAGVCGGLARYFGIDATIVRLLWVALTFAGAAGIIIYLVMWAVVPEEPLPQDQVVAHPPDTPPSDTPPSDTPPTPPTA